MSVVDLDGIDGLTPASDESPAMRLWQVFRQRVRDLPLSGQVALFALLIGLALIVTTAFAPWGTTVFQLRSAEDLIGPRSTYGIYSVGKLAQCGYYAIWLAALGAGTAAVLDQARHHLWYAVAAAAIATQALVLIPIERDPNVLVASTHLTPVRITHSAGSYCAIAALFIVAAAMILAIQRPMLSLGEVTAAILFVGAYAIVAVTQWIPWFTSTSPSDTQWFRAVNVSPHFAPHDALAGWQITYYLVWLVVFSGGALLIVAKRHHRTLFGATAGALATQTLILAGPLHDPRSAYPVFLISSEPQQAHTAGSYAVIAALVVTGIALVASMGGRIWPKRLRSRLGIVLLGAGFALALAAQLLPWASDHIHAARTSSLPPMNLAEGSAAQMGYDLSWLAAFAGVGALIYARGRRRLVLLGAVAGALATQLIVVTPVLHRPSSLSPLFVPGFTNLPTPTTTRVSGSGVELAAIAAMLLATRVAARTGAKRGTPAWSPGWLAVLLGIVGFTLAIGAQVLHWFDVTSVETPDGLGDSTFTATTPVWASMAPTSIYLAMIVCWLLALGGIGIANYADGRTRARSIRFAFAALMVEAALTAAAVTDGATAMEKLIAENSLSPTTAFKVHLTYGLYVQMAALAVLALSLACRSDRWRRLEPAVPVDDPENTDTEATAPSHLIYMRPTDGGHAHD